MTANEQSQRDTLAGEIEARKAELASRALERMYENPFWDARFGERGRSFAAEDGQYHVTYLVEALRSGNQQIVTRYARWLQSVLTTRGMCSLHVAENFSRLADVIVESDISNPAPAVAFLDAGIASLHYDSGTGRAVQQEADVLLSRAVRALVDLQPSRDNGEDPPGHAQVRHDLPYLLSYLADALALDRPEAFVDHVRWLAGFHAGQDISRDSLNDTLLVLEESLHTLREADCLAAGAIVRQAREALEAGA